ncbi:hypothetical protein LINGRAHAP2_LOCUS23103 [Linum grandiflorum]
MKLYIDEDGFPKASLMKQEEEKFLLKIAEDHNRLNSLVDDDMDDVYDESLLPISTRTTESPLRSEFKLESAIEDYTTKKMEAIRISDAEAFNFSSLAPVPISYLLAQKLKDVADTLAQASKSVPKSLKMGNKQNPEGRVMKAATSEVAEHGTKPRTRKRQGSNRKEDGSKKQMIEEKKVEAASLEWLPEDK